MLFVIHGIDKPRSPLREQFIDEHRAYLATSPIDIIASGPLMDDRGEQMIGSVIIVNCENRSAVDRFMADEPFNLAGLYENLKINRWHQRVGDIARQEYAG